MIYLQTLPPPRTCWSANIPTTTGKTTDPHKTPEGATRLPRFFMRTAGSVFMRRKAAADAAPRYRKGRRRRMAPPPVLYNSFAFTAIHLSLRPAAAAKIAALASAEVPSPYCQPAYAAGAAVLAGAEVLCSVSYSLPSLRMLRRISCQETKNAAIR